MQGALELDFFDGRAARELDEGWCINHTFLFVEYFRSYAKSTLRLYDRTWSAGLGFVM